MNCSHSLITRHQKLALLTREEVAFRCGLHPALLERFVMLGLIDPAEGHGDLFPPEVTLKVQRILRLRRDLGITYNTAGLVLDLLERIDALEARLRHLEGL